MVRLFCSLPVILGFVAASWAALGDATGLAAAISILLALAIHVWAGRFRWCWSFRIAVVMLWILALSCVMQPLIIAARDAARDMHCRNNLKQIGLALRAYRDSIGRFPLAATQDGQGRPMHSWRLIILPYLDCSSTYYMWKLNEPWDSPTNAKPLATPKYVYKCPADPDARAPDSNTTTYVAVVGRTAASPPGRGVGRNDSASPELPIDSFLVIEMANSRIAWAEPKDVHFDDVDTLRSLAAACPHARNNGYFLHNTPAMNAVLVTSDMVFILPSDSSTSVLTGLLRPTEAQMAQMRLDHHGLKYDPFTDLYIERPQVHWRHCIGLPALIVTFGLLLSQARRARRADRTQ
jgi:hypothetical protein